MHGQEAIRSRFCRLPTRRETQPRSMDLMALPAKLRRPGSEYQHSGGPTRPTWMRLARMLTKSSLASNETGLTKPCASVKNTSGSCSIRRPRRFMGSTSRAAAPSQIRRAPGSWATRTRGNSSAGICTTCSIIRGKTGLPIQRKSAESSGRFDSTRPLTSTTKSSGEWTGPVSSRVLVAPGLPRTGRWSAPWSPSLTSPNADSWRASFARRRSGCATL